jgi:hypothetical protein
MNFQRLQPVRNYTDFIDRKRWLVRYLMLSAVGIVLALKIYLMLFVIDFIGDIQFLFKFCVTKYAIFAYTKYKYPYLDAKDISLSTNSDSLPFFPS